MIKKLGTCNVYKVLVHIAQLYKQNIRLDSLCLSEQCQQNFKIIIFSAYFYIWLPVFFMNLLGKIKKIFVTCASVQCAGQKGFD